ncbi:MAG: hypothetical protein WCK26_00905 [Candidatus Saccharibacteria bacterium]
MDQMLIFFLAAVLIVGAVMLTLILNSKKGSKKLNVERYRVKCLEIENQLRRDQPSSFQMTVLNADKLVDQALKGLGIKGKTMAERMKNSVSLYSDRNGIWTAHKLRNQIAHESDVNVTYEQARQAIASFKKALKDIGAI